MRLLTLAEKRCLVGLIEDAIKEGSYYGNKELYYARLNRLLKWASDQPFKWQ